MLFVDGSVRVFGVLGIVSGDPQTNIDMELVASGASSLHANEDAFLVVMSDGSIQCFGDAPKGGTCPAGFGLDTNIKVATTMGGFLISAYIPPTASPTSSSLSPTASPTLAPQGPTLSPMPRPTLSPIPPTSSPTKLPTASPSQSPTNPPVVEAFVVDPTQTSALTFGVTGMGGLCVMALIFFTRYRFNIRLVWALTWCFIDVGSDVIYIATQEFYSIELQIASISLLVLPMVFLMFTTRHNLYSLLVKAIPERLAFAIPLTRWVREQGLDYGRTDELWKAVVYFLVSLFKMVLVILIILLAPIVGLLASSFILGGLHPGGFWLGEPQARRLRDVVPCFVRHVRLRGGI